MTELNAHLLSRLLCTFLSAMDAKASKTQSWFFRNPVMGEAGIVNKWRLMRVGGGERGAGRRGWMTEVLGTT